MMKNPSFSHWRALLSALVFLALLILSACGRNQRETEPVQTQNVEPLQTQPLAPTPSEPAPPPPTSDQASIGQNAMIESIELQVMESMPVQVTAILRGSLPDGCTEIESVQNVILDHTIHLEVFTIRPTEASCTQAPAPFEKTVKLPAYGLPEGEYTVEAGGAAETFNLAVPNVPDGVEVCAEPQGETLLIIENDQASGINYCFLFPAGFVAVKNQPTGVVTVLGPEHDEGPEPGRAWLNIQTYAVGNQTLEEFVDGWIEELDNPDVAEEPVTLGGKQQALALFNLPGQTVTRAVFAKLGTRVYILIFGPDDPDAPDAQSEMQLLYDTVLPSWRFLP